MGKRILFVAMHHSIHAARWIDLVDDAGWSLAMFPLDPNPPSPNLRNVALYRPVAPLALAATRAGAGARRLRRIAAAARHPARIPGALKRLRGAHPPATPPAVAAGITEVPFPTTLEELGGPQAAVNGLVRLGESDCSAPALYGPAVLASVIRRVEPDLIHSMEFQHAGYLALKAKELYGPGFPPWLATNWGSDIYYFSRFADHRAQIRRLLANVDFYSCECHRDVDLARQLGFAGMVMPVLPNSGGFDLDAVARLRSPAPPSQRKIVMVKGYEHFAGRGMRVLAILVAFADRLGDYEIIMHSASAEPRRRALDLARRGVLNIRVIDWAPHEEMMSTFGRARLHLAISVADGIGTSALEAMAMGAFPIQTNTSCCSEWFEDGVGGFLVPPDNVDVIADRFQRALADDALVDRAAEINQATVAARLDKRRLKPQVAEFYATIFQQIDRGRREDEGPRRSAR